MKKLLLIPIVLGTLIATAAFIPRQNSITITGVSNANLADLDWALALSDLTPLVTDGILNSNVLNNPPTTREQLLRQMLALPMGKVRILHNAAVEQEETTSGRELRLAVKNLSPANCKTLASLLGVALSTLPCGV